MGAARDKLLEADYFLQRMRKYGSDLNTSDAFKYNLSALLSAARSVRWLLEKEYEHQPGFKEWWNSKREWVGGGDSVSDIADPVRAASVFFDATRNITIHGTPGGGVVGLSTRAAVTATLQIHVGASHSARVMREDDTSEKVAADESEPPQAPKATATEADLEWRWYFRDLPPVVQKQDVIALSQEHLERLEAFVSEAESKFVT